MSKRRASNRRAPDDKYSEILEHVLDLSDAGRKVSELFLAIPSAQLYPDYRDIVAAPISLAEISKRVRLKTYESDDEFAQDFSQMATNAALYNGTESPVVDDALIMYDFVLAALGRPQSEMSLRRDQILIVQDMTTYKYRGQLLAEAFLELPSKKDLPNYYKVIKKPVSFTEIKKKLESGPYKDWDEFESAVGQIFTNAMQYNAEGTPIYANAKTLSRQLHNRIVKTQKSKKPVPALRFHKAVKGEENVFGDIDFGPTVHRFDDDDDDDFEEDQEENDEDDDNDNPLDGQSDIPQKQIVVRDEIVKRPKGASAKDAMLQLVTCSSILHHSVLHTMHYGGRGDKPQIPPAYARDMVQVRVSASKKDSFTSFSTTLPSYHHTLTLTVYLHDRMRMLPHNLTVILNGRKLQNGANATPDANAAREEFELRLSPGLNQVTVAVIGPDSAGTVRPYGPPPIVGAEADEERLIMWLNLSR